LQHKLAPFIERLRRRFALPRTAEITVEANPGTVNQEILASLATAGVNRLSLGLQSASDELLKACGRLHSWEDFLQTWRAAREVGFKNISLDLIYGLPGQTLASWSQTLSAALALAPEHISLYALSVEEGCGWATLPEAAFPAEEEVAEDYQLACEVLERRNYVHYELSNWSQPGRESRHNLLYWTGGEYLGLGAAAHSSLGNARVWNCWPVSDYLQRIACEDRTLTYSWALPAACGIGLWIPWWEADFWLRIHCV
jgi:oxygen-independent coproporphyrinogen-3 oxidase